MVACDLLAEKTDKVKIRGVRIELDEVEAALLSVTGVDYAAVKVVKGPGNLPVTCCVGFRTDDTR